MRLNRLLAQAGRGSRRACDDLIREGRVQVNGETATLPGPSIDPAKDAVLCDGERVRLPRQWLYLAMNKPSGIVTSRADELGRTTVDEFLGRLRGRVFPIGRLDRPTEGLLLLTNNGELAQRLLHPRYRQERTYLAWVQPIPDLDTLRRIARGVPIGRGERSGPATIRVLGRRTDTARVKITLREGKNREVRRIFSSLGMHVTALRRIAYAGILLGELKAGGVRSLTRDEVVILEEKTRLAL